MKRTKEDAEETGRQILKAAEQLFIERGYESVTLDQIAAAAGASRGAVHWHFVNKQGLLKALRMEAQLPLQQAADGLDHEAVGDPLELLADAISSMFIDLDSDERRRGLIGLMLRIDVSTHAAPSSGPNDSYQAVERIFREADKRQKLRAPWTPKLATSAVSAVVIGILEEWAFDRSNFPLNPHGKDVICTLLKGFVACADDTT